MQIPEAVIEEIRVHLEEDANRGDLSIFEPHLKEGKFVHSNYWACCPFHREDTASFKLDTRRGLYHCFGCKASGNLIKLYMNLTNAPFPDAMRDLGLKYGIEVSSGEQHEIKSKLRGGLELATSMFVENLSDDIGRKALDYILARKIPERLIREFKLGYARDTWDSIKTRLQREGLKEDELIETGLVVDRERTEDRDRTYDRFRNRLMFPIYDQFGRICGFSGRALDKDQQAKYLNSPETDLYKKAGLLFGLSQALKPAREQRQLYIVEGTVDVLAMAAQEIRNTSAPCGTAFTENHAQLIKKCFRDPRNLDLVFVYDGDKAGQTGILRSAGIAFKAGLSPRVVVLPEDEDPASLHQKGVELSGLLKPVSFFDFTYDYFTVSEKGDTPESKVRIIDSMKEFLKEREGPKGAYIDEIARRLNISQSSVLELILPSEIEKYMPARESDFICQLMGIAKTTNIRNYFIDLALAQINSFSQFGRAAIYYISQIPEGGLAQQNLFNEGIETSGLVARLREVAHSHGVVFTDKQISPPILEALQTKEHTQANRRDLEKMLVDIHIHRINYELGLAMKRGVGTQKVHKILDELSGVLEDE